MTISLISLETRRWLAKFDNLIAAVEEREIYHSEAGLDLELDFISEDDTVYAELLLLLSQKE